MYLYALQLVGVNENLKVRALQKIFLFRMY